MLAEGTRQDLSRGHAYASIGVVSAHVWSENREYNPCTDPDRERNLGMVCPVPQAPELVLLPVAVP